MTQKKIDFDGFYQSLLLAKEGLIKRDSSSASEQYIYQNLKNWCLLGIKDYITDTPLEDNSFNPPNEPPRADIETINDVKYDKGISLIGFLGGVMNANEQHHNIIDDVVREFGMKEEDAILLSDGMKQSIVEEVLENFDFDIGVCIDSYHNVEEEERWKD